MNEDNNLDLLDLDDDTSLDVLPDATPFSTPRPKKPWLLLGVGLGVIVLATYIIVRTIGGDSSSSMQVDLDAPAVVIDGDNLPTVQPMPENKETTDTVATDKVPVKPVDNKAVETNTQNVQEKTVSKPVVTTEDTGVPVRVVEERKNVTFNPEKTVTKPVVKTTKTTTTQKTVKASNGSWYVQFGSYSTHAAAENAGRQMRSSHASLLQDKQFVILAARLPNGNTTHRLRIAFQTSELANGFCRNAKSDGLDCYVAK
ncbi:MAG: SPOR domain-containing protein [Alphaproteobacteria bacterium]|nr:SPOR domain-containing protein [Alphaproteobacteria bacterium]